jgi:Flp pilus assembly protein CpaB
VATEVKQRNNRIIMVVLGLVLAAAAFGLSLYVSKSGNNSSGTGGSGQQVNVVVAKNDLAQGSPLSTDVLTTKQYSVDAAPTGAITDPATITGKYLSIAVTMNTPITSNLLVADAASAKTAALSLTPLDIHAGNVAMGIPIAGGTNSSAELNTFGLYIQPDDRIDVMVDDGKGSVRFAFQDVRILKVGSYSAGGGGAANVLVVELPRGEAEAFTWLLDHSGQPSFPVIVRYVLRPKAQASPTASPNYVDTQPFNPPNKADGGMNQQSFSNLFPTH